MPLQATSGAASYDAFGGGVPVVPNYIEDVFSTYLYTGTNTNPNNIVNGIDLSTKGGMVWCKARSAVNSNTIWDSARGVKNFLITNATNANTNLTSTYPTYGLQSFNTDGFTLGKNFEGENDTGDSIVSWTFRKQPKFFDIVTYTGNGSSKTINHNLGSVPGVMIVKSTTYVDNWAVYHRSLGATKYIELNNTDAASTSVGSRWDAEPTSTSFSVGYNGSVNASGETYVAYLFAHDAGGFGLSGTDNVISCGSYTGNGTAGNAVTLGFEPQWIMIKKTSSAGGGWVIQDVMRGMSNTGSVALSAQSSGDEADYGLSTIIPTATGFTLPSYGGWNGSGETFIYIAIRRGPMKVPTSGTSVFAPSSAVEPQSSPLFTAGFSDMTLHKPRLSEGNAPWITDRLRGNGVVLETPYTSSQTTYSTYFKYDSNAGAYIPASGYYNNSGGGSIPYALYAFKRAPSFFDVVCYTGTGANRTVAHNLGVAPELMITKSRSGTYDWAVYAAGIGNTSYGLLNDAGQFYVDSSAWNNTSPTSSVFTVGTGTYMNGSGATYVAYLFATCAGVSKVGSYTGTGTTKQIDCGFTSGARFVLIKRTDSTGSWYVWDVARGISSGNDPYLLLNSTAAEVTNTDYIDAYSAGFEISSTAPAEINASGGTFIYLSIA